jgi:GTP-binding protein
MHASARLRRTDLRNVAIIAHVDHGKTTLVDRILAQTGAVRTAGGTPERSLDSGDLERERGITIMAKNASVEWHGVRLNIIDTPGHADFGGEVERTLRMADGFLLLVDAAEGPLPQTRFVLSKALELSLTPIVVINKIDRSDARPQEVLNEVFDLFIDLDAPEESANFPVIYTNARRGIARTTADGADHDLAPLLDLIVAHIPAPLAEPEGPVRVLVHDLDHDDYVGRLAVGRIWRGTVKRNADVLRLGTGDSQTKHRIARLYGFDGVKRVERPEASAGDIVVFAGIENAQIGDTLADPETPEALPRIAIDEPTVTMTFGVNTGPLGGRAGRHVTSSKIWEWLQREALRNVAIRVERTDDADTFRVSGRGEFQLAIIAESMRRDDYEFSLGMPEVIVRDGPNGREEPLEEVVIDCPEEYIGVVTERLGSRRGRLVNMHGRGAGRTRITFHVPSRGLLGFRDVLLTETRGTALMHCVVHGWVPWQGAMKRRLSGGLVADRSGKSTPYALFNLQPRGILFIGPGEDVYEGMVLGEHNRGNDLDVNVCREKKLTNVRAAGRDENVILSPPRRLVLEEAIAWIDDDELVEVTPEAIRLRKRELRSAFRPKVPRSKMDE